MMLPDTKSLAVALKQIVYDLAYEYGVSYICMWVYVYICMHVHVSVTLCAYMYLVHVNFICL